MGSSGSPTPVRLRQRAQGKEYARRLSAGSFRLTRRGSESEAELERFLEELQQSAVDAEPENKVALWQDHRELLLNGAGDSRPGPMRRASLAILATITNVEEIRLPIWVECRDLMLAGAELDQKESLRRPALWGLVNLSLDFDVRKELWETEGMRKLLLGCLGALF